MFIIDFFIRFGGDGSSELITFIGSSTGLITLPEYKFQFSPPILASSIYLLNLDRLLDIIAF